jgi:UDP-N-acetylglucosamine 2-epimerase (non-hydrolysing)
MHQVLVLVGNDSEAILMAPLVHRLRSLPSLRTVVYVAEQHRQLFGRMFGNCCACPDEKFDALQLDYGADLLSCINRMSERGEPDCALAYGAPVAVVDSFRLSSHAGNQDVCLRLCQLDYSGSKRADRGEIRLAGKGYFVWTETARHDLLLQGVAREKIYLADSMLREALQMVAARIGKDDELKAELAAAFPFLDPNRRLILVTEHRHAYNDARLESLCRALKRLAMRPDVQVVYVVQPDSMHKRIVDKAFAGHPNIVLIQPQGYVHLIYLMQSAYLVMTDPGNFLRETPSLEKPVLVLRDAGESPETVDWGTTRLIGTDAEQILRECTLLLEDAS